VPARQPLRDVVLGLLEHVVCTLGYMPAPELVALGGRLRAAPPAAAAAILRVLVQLANANGRVRARQGRGRA
jgi:hypothetical protein